MQVVSWPGERPAGPERTVATLGVFDGVHLGHQEVIGRAISGARRLDAAAAVVTFDRHPAGVIEHAPQPSITSLQHRLHLFEQLGVDLCAVVRFSEEVARIEAPDFARAVFRDFLRAVLVVLGFDCRFGAGGAGDVELCRELGPELGFEVESVPPVEVDGEPVSSTAIRRAILAGDFGKAGRLMGRPFSLYGTVVPGDSRGWELGFPTANLDLHNETVPPDGVYACRVFADDEPLPGVASIGGRKTFHPEPDAPRVVEVHLLCGGGDLYGQDIEVQFASRLRPQIAFQSDQELAEQIARDVEDAAEALGLDAPGG